MHGVSIWGIAAGTAIGFVLDAMLGIAGMAVLGAPRAGPGITHEQLQASVRAFTQTTPFLIYGLVLGTLTTVIGGYIAGRIGKGAPYLNAALLGATGIVIGLLLSSNQPLWFSLIAYALAIPAALLGGKIAARNQIGA